MRASQGRRRSALGALALCALVSGIAARADEAKGTPAAAERATATFAGGCFWCMQPAFDAIPGVISTTVGYTGGSKKDPAYEEVSSGATGHAESIEIEYDPAKVTYRRLLDAFWHNVDPTDAGGQFCDRGRQYRSAIFYHDEEQHRLAEQSKKELEESKHLPGPIVTPIVSATQFYRAEEYHQSYYKKNPLRYRFYRRGCGRERRLEQVWGSAPAH
jgi:peptide-methionine (S)-S-oxide reductase